MNDLQATNTNNDYAVMLRNNTFEIDCFKDTIKEKSFESSDVLDSLSKVTSVSEIVNEIKNYNKDFQYVVDMSDDLKKALEDGSLKLDCVNNKLYAQLKDAAGKYSDKLPIKKVPTGIDPATLMMAIQMQNIEKKLGELADTLADMSNDVETIRQGQENDRIGLYHSGLNQYYESKNIMDPAFKNLVTANAMKTICDAMHQEMMQVKADIDFLAQGKYESLSKKVYKKEIQHRLSNISKGYEIIHKSAIMRSEIYFERNEFKAMCAVMDEYSCFIKDTFVKEANLLYELDDSQDRIEGSTWERRALAFDNINDIKQQLSNSNIVYLPIAK